MTKQTITISQPAHLSLKYEQLMISLKKSKEELQRPIADLAMLVLDHVEITLTQPLLAFLGESNVAVTFCGSNHLPSSMLLSFHTYCLPAVRFRQQIDASKPLQKKLWQKTIKHKITQQAKLLERLKKENTPLEHMVSKVTSGDSTHVEAQAAKYYWKTLLGASFYRARTGPPPNQLLNYGYAILRAAVARSLAAHGLISLLGIHHRNQYNGFCLADDVMEPYRPFVDATVYAISLQENLERKITKEHKALLLGLLTQDCCWEAQRTSVGHAIDRTASSLASCFEEKNFHYLTFPTYYVSPHL